MLWGPEDLHPLHLVVAHVLAQSIRTAHALNVEVLLLQHEEGGVDAGVVRRYMPAVSRHLDSVVICH